MAQYYGPPLIGLHRGSVRELLAGKTSIHPVLQVLDVQEIGSAATRSDSNERFRIMLSDGEHFQEALLAKQFNKLVKNNALRKFSLVLVDECTCKTVDIRKILLVFRMQVVGWHGEALGAPTRPTSLDANLQSSLPSAGASRRSKPLDVSKAPLSASELAAATASADAAAAELLAEEEAAKAAKALASTALGSSLQRRRRKKLGGGASAEPDELDAATLAAPMPVMPPVAGAGASAEPSASAKRRQRRIAAKAASHHPPAVRPTSPVAAPSPEPALSDADEQAQPEAPEEPLEPAPLPVEIPLPPAPIPAAVPAVEDEAARLRRQLEALQLERNALKLKTAALELEKNAMEREKRAHESERESQLCTVCLDAPRSHVLFPCHHHCLCGSLECFRMLGTPPLCPICRSAVAQARQIY